MFPWPAFEHAGCYARPPACVVNIRMSTVAYVSRFVTALSRQMLLGEHSLVVSARSMYVFCGLLCAWMSQQVGTQVGTQVDPQHPPDCWAATAGSNGGRPSRTSLPSRRAHAHWPVRPLRRGPNSFWLAERRPLRGPWWAQRGVRRLEVGAYGWVARPPARAAARPAVWAESALARVAPRPCRFVALLCSGVCPEYNKPKNRLSGAGQKSIWAQILGSVWVSEPLP